ncbi:MAG: CocE/NonD family hydrolase [Kouleothrix sp.]|nr:CocE/NonD family hydrolase [Kouleothrix sp.]
MSDQILVEFDVPATMRDGVVLRANIFRPAEGGPHPVALARIPYGKDFASVTPSADAVRLARAGYIVVIQDVRGRFRSEGAWEPMRHEAEDGYDSVEWAAGLPGSSGAVGMFGLSYFGFTQWMAARAAPPHLKAIVPALTWTDPLDGAVGRGGALELGLQAYFLLNATGLDSVLRSVQGAPPDEQMRAIGLLVYEIDRLRTAGYASLPLAGFEPLARLGLAGDLNETIENAANPGYYAPFSIAGAHDRVEVPALNIGGWYDVFAQGALANYSALRDAGSTSAARQSRLLVGPWSHVNYSNVSGDLDFGFVAQMALINLQTDLTGLTQRWFDYWLKGIENGVTQEPPVKIFVMGDNVWRDEQEWPLSRARSTPFYLRAGGSLSPERPGAEPPDHYTYDPSDPTPTLGGNILMHNLFGPGPKDQRPIEARADVLGYTSDPLAQDVEVTGPLAVELWAASDAPDTDFVARLVDVHPDGAAINLADGIVRARYRNGPAAEPLEPGQPYRLTIDLWSTSNVFKAGHRIRVDVASASFPRWDRNPNTGAALGSDAELRLARQTILHDEDHPSHIVLPIILR